MKLEHLRQHLVDSGVVDCPNDSVYIHNMPETVDTGVLFRPPTIGASIDYELDCFRRTMYRTIIRAKTYEEGLELATQVSQALYIINSQVDDFYIYYSRAMTEPIAFPQSVGDYAEFLLEFEINFYEITT